MPTMNVGGCCSPTACPASHPPTRCTSSCSSKPLCSHPRPIIRHLAPGFSNPCVSSIRYVSDHGWDGYKAVCQRKLLQAGSARGERGERGERGHSQAVAPSRTYPPCLLEWRANRKRVNMALPVHFADGEQRVTPVESWTTSEELASLVVRERGIAECGGWSVSLATSGSGSDLGLEPGVKDSAGYDYVLDLVSEMELAPAFPACRNSFLSSPDKPKRTSSSSNSKVLATPAGPVAVEVDVDEVPLPSPTRRPGVPPPEPPLPKQPVSSEWPRLVSESRARGDRSPIAYLSTLQAARKPSREMLMESKKPHAGPVNGHGPGPGRLRSQSRDHTVEMGLSRKSALNDRYFEDKPGRSRSLDNLLESVSKMHPSLSPPRHRSSSISRRVSHLLAGNGAAPQARVPWPVAEPPQRPLSLDGEDAARGARRHGRGRGARQRGAAAGRAGAAPHAHVGRQQQGVHDQGRGHAGG